MRKKWTAALLALLLCALPAHAAPRLSQSLFKSASAAVNYLISGEYERLVTLLPFSGVAPGATEWERFSRNFAEDAEPSREGVVAYWEHGKWNIAAPIDHPSDGETDALVLLSADGKTFTGYRYAAWDQVEAACAASDNVVTRGD